MPKSSHRFGALLTSAALALAAAMALPHQAAQAQRAVTLDTARHAGQFVVPLNKSQLLKVNQPFSEVTVGNAEIADVIPLTTSSVYVLGKEKGATNVSLVDEDGRVIAVVDVVVTHDTQALKAKLHELLPDERIEVRSAGHSVVLSGQVSSSGALRQALAVAEQYAPKAVTNMLAVGGSQQVLLKVRFAEVARSTMKDIGSNVSILGVDGNDTFSVLTGDGIGMESFGAAIANVVTGSYQLDFVIDALEEKGMVRTLSEPNIIAMSGDSASFLAGGEFPIPVAQASNGQAQTITIEFKPFGVGLDFTPTVIGRDNINLELSTEVSSIDPSVSVVSDGLVIPGLKVRRASTTVELKDGQSFAIAGLLQDNFEDTVRQLPGFGDIPVLGALARSADYERNQTELVVFITAYLVQPTDEALIATPTDSILPPTHFELFLLGQTEGRPALANAAGISGSYGYILP